MKADWPAHFARMARIIYPQLRDYHPDPEKFARRCRRRRAHTMLLLLAHAAASFSSTSVMRGHASPHLTRPLVSRVAQPPSMLAAASVLSSPLVDPIATGFELVTLVPQPFWLLLILLPNWKVCAASLNGTLRHTVGRLLIGIFPGRLAQPGTPSRTRGPRRRARAPSLSPSGLSRSSGSCTWASLDSPRRAR